ncbi:MAG: efflux RND transporter periplasmic adaptor subunit [Polyangiaceae bacterium]|nr:efflux RND transporter periplasmic adaptor subunit [Polyangiaceae bacterium]
MIEPKPETPAETSEVMRVLARGRPGLSTWLLRVVALLFVVGGVAGFLSWRSANSSATKTTYQTTPVEKGSLVVSVTATGTLEALNSVDVGSEITGRVTEVLVQFNDKVLAGQVLAKIDTETYLARMEEAQAQLSARFAALKNSKATLNEARLKVERTKTLHAQGLSSQQELEAAQAAAERAEASVSSDNAQATLSNASLKVAKSNLDKTIVTSPIDGVVLDRLVEPGQTVTSGLQTPVLFTIAASLDAMRLEIAVDEADVGMVVPDQAATFTVDAYPDRVFKSRVLTVKNLPNSTSSVVTYTAWLAVDNDESLLRPGMTATAEIVVSEEKDVLLVPNAALRFSPPKVTESAGFSFTSLFRRGPPREDRKTATGAASASGKGAGKAANTKTLWVLRDGEPQSVTVTVGKTSGTKTKVESRELAPQTLVIVNAVQESK